MSESNTKSGKRPAKQQPELHFTPPQLTQDEILRRGEEAAQALASPVMNLAFESTVKSIQDEWLSTAPEEMKRREWLYLKAQALGHVATELSIFVRLATAQTAEDLHRQAQNQRDEEISQGFMQ